MALPGFDPFAPGAGTVTVLFAARLTGLMLVAPVFSARTIPAMLKAGMLVALVALLEPVALSNVREAPALGIAAAMSELLIGFTLGMGAAMLVAAAELAGDLTTTQIGLSGAALLDPLGEQSSPALGVFAQLFAVTVMLTVNAHLELLDALAQSTRVLPVGAPVDTTAGMAAMLSQAGTMFALGARFAAPVVATVLIANVALAALSRAAPTINILTVAFPIQITVGLLAFAAALPLVGAWFAGWSAPYDGMMTRVFDAFATGAR